MEEIIVECKSCGEPIQAKRSDELLTKKVKHMRECHPGFTEVRNPHKE